MWEQLIGRLFFTEYGITKLCRFMRQHDLVCCGCIDHMDTGKKSYFVVLHVGKYKIDIV